MKTFFSNYSSEQFTRILSAVFIILGFFGYKAGVSAEQVVNAFETIFVNGAFLVAFVADLYGYFKRYKKGDVT